MDFLKHEFANSLKYFPGVAAGYSNPENLLSLCFNTGKNKDVVMKAAASAMKQAKAFPEGHPSREMAFDVADALYFYHDYLDEVERYEEEKKAASMSPSFSVV